jgi:hypothetical protein
MSTYRPSTRPTHRRVGGAVPSTDFAVGQDREDLSVYSRPDTRDGGLEESYPAGEGREDGDTLLEAENGEGSGAGSSKQVHVGSPQEKGKGRNDLQWNLRPNSNSIPGADRPRLGSDSLSAFWLSFLITALSLGFPTLVLWKWLRGNGHGSIPYSTRRGAWLGAAVDWAGISLVAFIAWIGTGESMISGYVAASVIAVAFVVSPFGFFRGLQGWYTLSEVTRSTYLDLFVVAFVILCLTVFALVIVARSLVRALQYSM